MPSHAIGDRIQVVPGKLERFHFLIKPNQMTEQQLPELRMADRCLDTLPLDQGGLSTSGARPVCPLSMPNSIKPLNLVPARKQQAGAERRPGTLPASIGTAGPSILSKIIFTIFIMFF